MRRVQRSGRRVATWAVGITAMVLIGCGESAPSVSSSSKEVTIKGVVKYKGGPVKNGTIQFDPANIQRKDAKAATASIGADGSYTIKTLEGENTVSFVLPELAKKDFSLASESFVYDAPSGESTYNIELGR